MRSNRVLVSAWAGFIGFALVGHEALAQTGSMAAPETTKAPTYTAPRAGGGAAKEADNAKDQQMLGAGMSAIVGAMFIPKCYSSKPGAACVMAAMSFAQAAMSLSTAGGSGRAANAMMAGGYDGGYYDPALMDMQFTDPTNPYGGTGGGAGGGAGGSVTTGRDIAKLVNGLGSDLQRAGVHVSDDKVKLPNGKVVPFSAMASEEGMKEAGFSDSEISAAKKLAAEAAAKAQAKLGNKIRAVAMKADGGGGGAGGAGGAGRGGAGAGDASMGFDFNGMFGGKNGKGRRGAANVSGMSKKLGNDSIGVSGDNIFEMITRRYKARDASNAFLRE